MVRSWMMVFLSAALFAGVAEARGRNRVVRYQTNSFQSQAPLRYSGGVTRIASTQTYGNRPLQVTPAGYQNSGGQSFSGGNSMQAWAEEEARMMASRGTCGHIRPAPPGYFVGVGCGATCMGTGTLVGEASFQGKMVRVWKR